VANYPGGSPRLETLGMEAEYHLIDLATGVSYGGFRSLEAARHYAREECLIAWEISFTETC